MNYKVEIDAGILKVRIAGNHNIWMYRAPRTQPIEAKPGIYVLADERGYCCYVGETDNFKKRMAAHESVDKFCWWTHTIYFWDASPAAVFSSTDDRRWYEKKMKEAIESKHPTFTKTVQHKPKPYSGDDVINEMLALLDVIGFETNSGGTSSATSSTGSVTLKPSPAPTPVPTAFPFKVGKVVQAVFEHLQHDSRMTKAIVGNLCNKASSKLFKTGGCPVLIPRTGRPGETRDKYGHHRYYERLPLSYFGKGYWLTSQFAPKAIIPVFSWLSTLGMTEKEVLSICKHRWP